MKVKCKSGLTGWRMRLQAVYNGNLGDWLAYSCTYGLAQKLGYETAQDAWEANPMIEGSTDPSDYRVVDDRRVWTYRGCRVEPIIAKSRYFGHPRFVPDSRCVQYRTKFWRVNFPDQTWTFCGTKDECRDYIDNPRNDRHLRAV